MSIQLKSLLVLLALGLAACGATADEPDHMEDTMEVSDDSATTKY